ncbi:MULTISPECIES: hypothetical protein [unclassified Shinella]|uniref:hypothetical protein n=1 Tax=unclassified Shinella TaxID=2643062 RepID=UPI00225D8089|nr:MULTISPECIES: hypothetical protein [unclassified Shinella]MCO5137431.1 hypothetical protein [Shinella sp.]MDC7257391.1 hypothetical protein [Shinella sp. YE25]CAI0340282.1 hypothetical protein SHINE37_44150 [Rhizobiaceae bacterium]CAK7258655.1 protein of unknown function [Shinella sp. WSC3-e]
MSAPAPHDGFLFDIFGFGTVPPQEAKDGVADVSASLMALRAELLHLRSGVAMAAMDMPAKWSVPFTDMTPVRWDDLLTRIDDHLARAWIALQERA